MVLKPHEWLDDKKLGFDKFLIVAWSDEPPSSILRISLNHKKVTKERSLNLDPEIMT